MTYQNEKITALVEDLQKKIDQITPLMHAMELKQLQLAVEIQSLLDTIDSGVHVPINKASKLG